jgi:hypothetical protein
MKGQFMAKSPKSPASGGMKPVLPPSRPTQAPGFDPGQSRLPQGLKPGKRMGGKPKLFPGRTGGR